MLELAKFFPRKKLGFYPSPIHKLSRLSKVLDANIWVKRDDMCSGLAGGGNKIRKLEWLVADALAQSCDTLVSIGNIQSNHTRQVAAVAAMLGLQCVTVQETWTKWDDPIYDKVGNILLTRLMGGNTILAGEGYSTAIKTTWEEALAQVENTGNKPYAIPAGASDHPLGGLGYAHFADEVALQEAQLGIFFDTIVVATCTGSTQAGMIVGFAAQKKQRRIIGIDTAHDVAMTYTAVNKIMQATAELIEHRCNIKLPVTTDNIEINADYSAPGYGLPSQQTIEAICLAAQLEAMITDPVYEGKSFAGLIDLCTHKKIQGSNILYVHLGGTAALHAYQKAFNF